MIVKRFQDLEVYQIAFELQQMIFEASKSFPREEMYSLTDQIRRSSRSVGANIAEAWRKRRYPAHFASKLTDSDGENAETQHWLMTAYSCHYISEEQKNQLFTLTETIGSKLGRMIENPEAWKPR